MRSANIFRHRDRASSPIFRTCSDSEFGSSQITLRVLERHIRAVRPENGRIVEMFGQYPRVAHLAEERRLGFFPDRRNLHQFLEHTACVTPTHTFFHAYPLTTFLPLPPQCRS